MRFPWAYRSKNSAAKYFQLPAALTSDAISVAAMSETIAGDESLFKYAYEWGERNYPGLNIEMEMVCGIFIEELQDKVGDKEVALIVMGAGGKVLFFHFRDI